MKKIILSFLLMIGFSRFYATQERLEQSQQSTCMVCRNTDRLLNVGATQICHRYLCAICYSENWEQPILRDSQTGELYWNFQCSQCAQNVRFYSAATNDRYLPDVDCEDQ